ncbi:hypothetical protein HOD20_10335 [archaeon]|jgi:hypothetical protein|nr:hypothetical protein [archaeon]MBT4352907.1 hypothetical protein [archaeon]MBT4648463.1 hypothetical protein [archaeon]MBT6821728.1 hypothetical protein [archaeon]MBT7391391.1 hypothetical protein [archaeon]
MKKINKFTILLILIILISSCTQKLSDDVIFRIDILYEHTILMEDYSKPETLQSMNIDVDVLEPSESIDTIRKMELLEMSYGMETEGTYEERVSQLEDKMNQLMDEWVLLENS